MIAKLIAVVVLPPPPLIPPQITIIFNPHLKTKQQLYGFCILSNCKAVGLCIATKQRLRVKNKKLADETVKAGETGKGRVGELSTATTAHFL